jgi:hypothetical protein
MKLSELHEAEETLAEKLARYESEVDKYLSAGEIVRPQFALLKVNIDRTIEKLADQLTDPITIGQGTTIRNIGDDALMDLLYAGPHNANELLFLKKKLAKVKTTDHPLYKVLVNLYNKYSPLAEKLKKLKEMVVTTAQKRAEKKEVEKKVKEKTFSDSSTLVKVLEEHMDEYINKAAELAKEQFNGWMNLLKKHNWDIDKAAPKPDHRDDDTKYRIKNHVRSLLFSMTESAGPGISPLRKFSARLKKDYVEKAKRSAKDAYMAWIHKMIQKIGKPVVKAKMTGNPWVSSVLTVTTSDDETQRWKTQMIINKSKYDLFFNQFPSRRID